MSDIDNYPSNMRKFIQEHGGDEPAQSDVEETLNDGEAESSGGGEVDTTEPNEVDPAQAGRERKQREEEERKKLHESNQAFLAERLAAKNEELSLKEKRIAELEEKARKADELEARFNEEKAKEESKPLLSESARELLGDDIANELESHLKGKPKGVTEDAVSVAVQDAIKKEQEKAANAMKGTRQEMFFREVGTKIPELGRLNADPEFVEFLSNTPLEFSLAKRLNTPTALGALNAFAELQNIDDVQTIREIVDSFLNKDVETKDKKELSSGMPKQMATPKMVSKKREMTSADLAKAKSFLRANDIKGHDKFMAQFE